MRTLTSCAAVIACAGWLLGYGSPHTRRAYARDLTRWVAWCDQLDVDPLAADRVHVDTWARHLSEGLALAAATVARRLAAISAFYRWCVLEQHLIVNPAVHVRRPEVDPDASTTLGLTAGQARTLLDAASTHSPRMRALIALLLVDGLRISEALTLDVDHVQAVDRGHRIATLRRKGGRTARAAHPYGGIEPCDRGAFAPVGAQVSTALIWFQIPFDETDAAE